MKKFIGLTFFLNTTYGVQQHVFLIEGRFDRDIGGTEVVIGNHKKENKHSFQNDSNNRATFTWKFYPDSSLDHFKVFKLRFQYKVNNPSSNSYDREIDLIISDRNKKSVFFTTIDESKTDFTDIEIELDKEQFLEALDEKYEYSLVFQTQAFIPKVRPNYNIASKWEGLTIKADKTNRVLAPILILE